MLFIKQEHISHSSHYGITYSCDEEDDPGRTLGVQLRRDGVTVQGHIISRHEFQDRGTHAFYLKYKHAFGGVSYEHQNEIQQSDYEAHPEGVEVSVICLPPHPKTAHLLINGRLDGRFPY